MSQENVEIVRRGINAFNRGDLDEVLADYAPDVEWHTTGEFADDASIAGMRAWNGSGRNSARTWKS